MSLKRKTTKAKGWKREKDLNVDGAVLHVYRHAKLNLSVTTSSSVSGVDADRHYHTIGISKGGYRCSDADIQRVRKAFHVGSGGLEVCGPRPDVRVIFEAHAVVLAA